MPDRSMSAGLCLIRTGPVTLDSHGRWNVVARASQPPGARRR